MLEDAFRYPFRGDPIRRTAVGSLLVLGSVFVLPRSSSPATAFASSRRRSRARRVPGVRLVVRARRDGRRGSRDLAGLPPRAARRRGSWGDPGWRRLLRAPDCGTGSRRFRSARLGTSLVVALLTGVVLLAGTAVTFAIYYAFPAGMLNYARTGRFRAAFDRNALWPVVTSGEYLLAMAVLQLLPLAAPSSSSPPRSQSSASSSFPRFRSSPPSSACGCSPSPRSLRAPETDRSSLHRSAVVHLARVSVGDTRVARSDRRTGRLETRVRPEHLPIERQPQDSDREFAKRVRVRTPYLSVGRTELAARRVDRAHGIRRPPVGDETTPVGHARPRVRSRRPLRACELRPGPPRGRPVARRPKRTRRLGVLPRRTPHPGYPGGTSARRSTAPTSGSSRDPAGRKPHSDPPKVGVSRLARADRRHREQAGSRRERCPLAGSTTRVRRRDGLADEVWVATRKPVSASNPSCSRICRSKPACSRSSPTRSSGRSSGTLGRFQSRNPGRESSSARRATAGTPPLLGSSTSIRRRNARNASRSPSEPTNAAGDRSSRRCVPTVVTSSSEPSTGRS